MKILLVGFQGYIGSGLFKYLNVDHEVIGWGKSDDILTISREYLLQNKIDVIINTATVMDRVGSTFLIDSLTYEVNIRGMESLVTQLKDTNIKLIYISTKDVYGNVFNKKNVVEADNHYKIPYFVDDDHLFNPQTSYGKSKLIGEYIAECHANHIIIRLSSCYTDFDHYRGHWVPNLMKSLLENSNIKLTNQGKQVRDLLHVIDLGRLINIILESDKKGLKINAGGGKKNIWSLLQFVKIMDSESNISSIPGDDYGFVFSNNLVAKELKWEPKILFQERLPIIKKNLVEGVSAIKPTNEK
jgi:nucleoside-diphosphate-sugar epimerase